MKDIFPKQIKASLMNHSEIGGREAGYKKFYDSKQNDSFHDSCILFL